MKTFKDFINEDRVISFAQKTDKVKFVELANKGKIGGKSISEILSYIDKNSTGKLDFNEIRKSFNCKTLFLYKIDTKKLKIQDAEIVKQENKDFKSKENKMPIVVGADYEVVDGRHRAISTKGEIDAYLPADIFWEEANK